MGHKGVSIRKPKKSKPFSKNDINSSSNAHPNEHSLVQSLVKDKSAPLNKGGTNTSAGPNQKHHKGN